MKLKEINDYLYSSKEIFVYKTIYNDIHIYVFEYLNELYYILNDKMNEYLIKVSGGNKTINILDTLYDYNDSLTFISDIDYDLLKFNYITDKQIVINYFINYLKKLCKKFG